MEFSPKKSTICRRYCCVPQCKSLAGRDRNLSFHTFPNTNQECFKLDSFNNNVKINRRKEWIRVLKIGKDVTNTMFVCSHHFQASDFLLPHITAQKRYLKRSAIPSLNLPQGVGCKKPKGDSVAALQRKERAVKFQRGKNVEDLPLENVFIADDANAKHLPGTSESTTSKTQVETRSIGVQVDYRDFCSESSTNVQSGDFTVPFSDIIDTNSKLNTVTGIQSFLILEAIVCYYTLLQPESFKNRLDNKSRVMLTLMKIKLNVSFVLLGVLFKVSSNTCKNIFHSTIKLLAEGLKCVVSWRSKEEILHNTPQCFEKYKQVRVVLDCTEIFVMKPNCLRCCLKCYSHYKGTTTIKYLVGVTPAGLVSYISPGYGGRASDKFITENCGILQKLEPYDDHIMVDKGFLIDDICWQYNIKVHRPPFLRQKRQFSRNEAEETRSIAKARVHVERAIQRMRIFQILNTRLSWNLVPLADDIVTVAAALANLSNPILNDNKF